VAAGHSVAPARWQAGLDELLGRVAGRFGRVQPRRRARALVLGLLSDLPRKNCWTIAEHAGDATPDGMQHLLARAVWDHDGVRDDVRAYLVEHLRGPGAVLAIDGTGDLKKGTATVGVQRQYTGTAGRIDNAQVAVYLVYASDAGHAIVGRELYLPRAWTCDPARCRAGGVPDQVGFATKPALATRMLTRAWTPGSPQDGWPGPRSRPRTSALARRRRSTRPKRPATRPSNSSNDSCHRAGSTSTLWPAATVFRCLTTPNDQRWPPSPAPSPAPLPDQPGHDLRLEYQ
jgi:hypothetical protein